MKLDIKNDQRVILTLDAGGTNFVFSAIKGNEEIIDPLVLPSNAHDLEQCIQTVIKGFEKARDKVSADITAISFAFPGPADYDLGIIGNLPNFKAFNGGVPLGPILEDHFGIPVFINNDGNLFAYGEALSGVLPDINQQLKDNDSPKRFKNIIGITLGTGLGAGIVFDKVLIKGDNSCGAEIHNTLNFNNPDWNAEESISTRAIIRSYQENGGNMQGQDFMPRDIAEIALGSTTGNKEAAIKAFRTYGQALGAAIANTVTLIDGLVVLGGGITKAWDLFSGDMFQEINGKYKSGKDLNNRLSFRVFNLEDEESFNTFSMGSSKSITVVGSGRKIIYDDMPRTGITVSKLGASRAIALGAYAYALEKLK
ncbi:MAG: ROK family protein [Bacteroidetes bacterium]|nr:MAG: ROK family protein [Bacteroidota bacterium]